MKDSGFSCIGEIPVSWSMKKVKHSFSRKNEKAMQEDPVILSLARSGVKVRDVSNNEGQIAESYFNYNPVEPGDLLLNPMDLYSGANCSISHVSGVISPAYINLKSKEGDNQVFYDYYFKVQYWLMAFFSYGKGVSFDNRWTLNAETLMNYPIVSLPFDEQTRIANFLDEKCSKIDAYIENQQAIIEKLKEYKLSVITEAVTKGLNPDATMKDSGVEWIEKVPITWNTKKLKHIVKTTKGFAFKADDFKNSGIPIIKVSNIKNRSICIGDSFLSESEILHYSKVMVYKDDILMTTVGSKPEVINSAVGQVALVPIELNKALLNQNAVRITTGDSVFNEYLFYCMQIKRFREYLNLIAHGTANQCSLSLVEILDFALPLPNSDEQKLIVSFLNKKCAAIDSSIEKKVMIIDKLSAYKKALIYEVVTGKKEV